MNPSRWPRAASLVFTGSLLFAAACGSTTVIDGTNNGAGGIGGGGGDTNTPVDCNLDAPGEPFVFTITNTGQRELALTFGCGSDYPIELDTPEGRKGIGAGNADGCEVSCNSVYQGNPNWGCSDCGPGSGSPLGPGQSASFSWDRRVFTDHVAPIECSGSDAGNTCALGTLVGATAVLTGVLHVCRGEGADGGYCSEQNEETFPVQVDMAAGGLTVEVQ